MSRIGRLPIAIPGNVKATIQGGTIQVEGPKGKLQAPVPEGITASLENGELVFSRNSELGPIRARHGLARSLAANCVKGVTEGFERKLRVVGVGYRVAVQGNNIEFHLGYSHPINFALPKGISATADIDKASKATILTLQGIDKQLIGQVAANIRSLRKPEPYKGKGIRYEEEKIRIKAGKSGK
ncbi:MAG: 50S ribosomal protein L6 [Acidobacteria bacterium]|nr:50S ribosomal protein L6 [Acidobacteriota bacterium]